MAEVFDNQVRGVAMALATVVNWLCAFAIVQCTSSILAITNPPWGGFFIYAGACGLAFLYIVALVPETKGKTLEQIQKEFGTAPRRNS